MSLTLLGVLILVLLIFRVPVAFALLGPSLLYIIGTGQSVGASLRMAANGVDSWPLLAVPLFILVGVTANRAGIADRLFELALAIIGRVKGSLGYVNIGVSVGFSWMSGSALADAAGLGAVEVPAMQRQGYPANFSVGITAASSMIGPIMPPSIPAIVYTAVATVSTGALFAASVVPALLLSVGLGVGVFVWAFRREEMRGPDFNLRRLGIALVRSLGAIGAPVIILGGILGGFFTPTEAAGVGAIYLLLLGFAYRSLKVGDLPGIFREVATTTGSIMLILAASALLGWILARERVPAMVADSMLQFTDSPLVFLLVANVILILLGTVIEPTSALVISVPILLPIGMELGIDPLHFGVIAILNLMIGLLTPPIGAVLYVLSSVTEISVEDVFKGVTPFLIPLLIVLLIVTVVPDIAMWMPTRLGL